MNTSINPLKLVVVTESGTHLGRVVDVTIDPDTQAVVSYHVKPSRLMPDMVAAPLIISRNQVISIDQRQMVVDEAVSKKPITAPIPQAGS